jgi:prevent-host-death family protein
MTSATIRQVQHNLAGILRRVEAGEEVIIRRRDRPVARMVPVQENEIQTVDWSSLVPWRARVFPGARLPGKAVSELVSEDRGDR